MNSVIKGASYVLAHTPQMVLYNGTKVYILFAKNNEKTYFFYGIVI